MSKAETLRAQLAHAGEEERLEQAVAAAGAAHETAPSGDALDAHNAACEALAAHRSKVRGQGVRVTATRADAAENGAG
jgi:hypothetical protein